MCVKRLEEEATKHPWDHVNATHPIGSGAYAIQPSCDLHRSAVAWFWLSPAALPHSRQHGLALPRLAMSHTFVPFFSPFFFVTRLKEGLFSMEEASFSFRCQHSCKSHILSLREGLNWMTVHIPSFLVHFFSASLFSLFQCLESKVQIHRNRTVLLGIHFSPPHAYCSRTSLFSCTLAPHKHIPHFLSFLFCFSTALVPVQLQHRSLNQCGHQLGCIRVYYLISSIIQPF